jgi:Lon protease-like protein
MEAPGLSNPIAIFPLPSTVFFPQTVLPLHIFEPRYLKMISDSQAGNQLIGMVLLDPGWESSYYEIPKIKQIGCVGRIEKIVSLPDGKFNIELTGLSRFKILEEIGGEPYRRANVEFLSEINDDKSDGELANKAKSQFSEWMRIHPKIKDSPNNPLKMIERANALSKVIDKIAYGMDFKMDQKQAILEETDVNKRTTFVMTELEVKLRILKFSQGAPDSFDARLN